MELQNQNGAHVQNGTAKEPNNKVAQNGAAKQENGVDALKTGTNGKVESEKQKPGAAKELKAEPSKPDAPTPNVQSKEKVEQPTAENHQLVNPVLNLEATLKTVNTLHRKSVQRLNLISRLKQIEAFEVALAQESDELEDNPYQGCKLIIEDDKQRRVVTTTPGLIRLVSQFIFSACNEKLVEIEASIVFPKA